MHKGMTYEGYDVCTVKTLCSAWIPNSQSAMDRYQSVFTDFKCRQRKQYARGQNSQHIRQFSLPFGIFRLRKEEML